MVYFVGAGCGAKDLITVRGAGLLARAKVIIYAGSLINSELLEYAAEDCEQYDSGIMNLEEILAVIEAAEAQGKMTVRLHSGDPSLYGAIREQMAELDKRAIAYEICPGVSAMSGAAAAVKAEYTPAGVSQTLIITRMEGKTAVPDREKMSSLAAHGASMAIFLSTGLLREVEAELMAGGYDPGSRAAIVYKASWPEEKVLDCTVSTLYETAKRNGIERTALILVGEFLTKKGGRSKLYDDNYPTHYQRMRGTEGR